MESIGRERQVELAKEFIKELDGTKNQYIQGFNKAAEKGSDAMKRWFAREGQYLPYPAKLAKLDRLGAKSIGKKLPIIRWGFAGAIATSTYSALRAQGNGIVTSSLGSAVEVVNFLPFTTTEIADMVKEKEEEFNEFLDDTREDIMKARVEQQPAVSELPPDQKEFLDKILKIRR